MVISCSLSPNTEVDDVAEALRVLLRPWVWRRGTALVKVKKWIVQRYGTKHAVLTNSGRSALYLLLKALGVGKGDEVILQTFTCVAVPNSIMWAGATPVYADIDERYNIDPKDIENKITPRTKAVIVQHTFGLSAQVSAIAVLCRKHKMFLLEDCAHSLGVEVDGHQTGTFGDAAFFSFGRDKVLSSVFGGAAIIKEKHSKEARKLEELAGALGYPSRRWIMRQILHPIAFSIILPLYTAGVGKVLLVLLQKLSLLSFPVYPQEKKGLRPSVFPARYPNGLAILLLRQLKKLDRYTHTRHEIARWYASQLKGYHDIRIPSLKTGDVPLRFPLVHPNTRAIRRIGRRRGILFGNWYHNVVDPKGVVYETVGYRPGSCPNAEAAASQICNLPTRLSTSDAKKVVNAVERGIRA